jgi:hypothetical protein
MNSLALLSNKRVAASVKCSGWIYDSYKLDLGARAGVYDNESLQLGLELFHEVF